MRTTGHRSPAAVEPPRDRRLGARALAKSKASAASSCGPLTRRRRRRRGSSETARNAQKLALLVVCIAAFAVYVHFMWTRLTNPHEGPPSPLLGDSRIMQADFRERCGRPTNGDEAIVVEILHSEDIKAWIEGAADIYMARCPNTQLRLRAMDDMAAVDALVAGTVEPTLWVPASVVALRYLEDRWEQSLRETPLRVEEGAELVRSPTVLLVWEDRFRVLDPLYGGWQAESAPWARSICAAVPTAISAEELAATPREEMVPGSWIEWKRARLAGAPSETPSSVTPPSETPPSETPLGVSDDTVTSWGRVAIDHTSPPRSGLGLLALYLMAHDFAVLRSPKAELTAEEFPETLAEIRADLVRWLRRCEAGLDKPLESALLLTESMFHVSSRHDGVVTSERHVFEVLDRIDDHGAMMRRAWVVYPEPTLWSDHPEIIFTSGDAAGEESREAGRRFVDLLRSREQQVRAIEEGLRPTHPEVVIRDHDVPRNPFLRLRAYGIVLEAPTGEPPSLDGAALRGLIEAWEDATLRN